VFSRWMCECVKSFQGEHETWWWECGPLFQEAMAMRRWLEGKEATGCRMVVRYILIFIYRMGI
jgi:hypothetical protein